MYNSTELRSTVCLYPWLLWKQLETRVMILISVHILGQETEFCFWWLKPKKDQAQILQKYLLSITEPNDLANPKTCIVSNSSCHLNQDSWQVQKVWITQYPFMAFIKNYMTNSLIIQEFPLNKRWLARACITSQKKEKDKAAVTYLLLSPKPPYSSSLVHTGDKLHLKKTSNSSLL